MGVCNEQNRRKRRKSYIKEKTTRGISRPISKNINKIIYDQLDQCICKINISTIVGTGFFCKIPFPDQFKLLPVLISCEHVLNEDFYSNSKEIEISFNNDKIIKKIGIDKERKFYISKDYDVTIIEIFPNIDGINDFLEINNDEKYEKKEEYQNLTFYVLQYPYGDQSCVSYGAIIDINEFEIEHKCGTETGSSGSPILILDTLKIIGVHKGSSKKDDKNNFGTLIRYPIFEFNKKYRKNEINIKVKIEKDDINKDVYILNYPYYINSDGKKYKYEGLKELNKSNTLMFINNEKVDYEKKKKFNKKGTYEIKLIININLLDAYCMFLGCKNIIEIDLTYFETFNINNMCAMFRNCINLTNINLSSFNTKNVTNMNAMFSGCKNLTDLDLFSFDTKNVTDMGCMFYGCNKLTNINLSSFDTKNVTDMSGMFSGCNKLTNINLSSFLTEKVTDMNGMFEGCKFLTNIDLSSFDTKNVTNMSGMFDSCQNLTNINLSSFDTKNVTNMCGMFRKCINITNIDLSSFETKNVTNMGYMLYNCKNLTNLNLSAFDIQNVTNKDGMFNGCDKLNNKIKI